MPPTWTHLNENTFEWKVLICYCYCYWHINSNEIYECICIYIFIDIFSDNCLFMNCINWCYNQSIWNNKIIDQLYLHIIGRVYVEIRKYHRYNFQWKIRLWNWLLKNCSSIDAWYSQFHEHAFTITYALITHSV